MINLKHYSRSEHEMVKAKALTIYKEEKISLVKLSKNLKVDRETLTKWVRESGMHIRIDGKNPINSHTFEKIDTEEKAYWLGFLFADGGIYRNTIELSLALKDTAHLEKFKKFMAWGGNLAIDNKIGRCRVVFADKITVKDLFKLGCTERKSLTLRFPTENQVPKHLIYHFIRGYFDGDGSINDPIKNGLGLSLLGTKSFLTSILNIFGFDANLKVKNVKQSQEVFFFALSGANGRWFLKNLYQDATVFLERKKERYEGHLCNCYENKKGRKCLGYESIKV